MKTFLRFSFITVLLTGFVCGTFVGASFAGSAKALDAQVDISLEKFKDIGGSETVLKKAEGILVFPKVFKAGFGIGGEYGEGALRIKGKTVDYYNTAAASFGFQIGGQKKTIILAFMEEKALNNFRGAAGWKVGVDASVAVIAVGAGGAINTAELNKPIVAFILDQKGLMYNLTLEGAKMSKIRK